MECAVELISPTLDLELEFWAMVEEFRAAGETRFDQEEGIKDNDFPAYVRWLQNGAQGIGLRAGRVPWSAFWLVNVETRSIVGVSSVRHRLTPFLEKHAGHIGYAIRPAERQKGYGTQILERTLEVAKPLLPDRAMLVCHSDNIGSIRIIQKHGGLFHDEVSNEGGPSLYRYWIDL